MNCKKKFETGENIKIGKQRLDMTEYWDSRENEGLWESMQR